MPPSELNTTRMQGLLARMREGDAAAGDRLIREAVARMEAQARRAMSRNPVLARWTQAEDLLQAALVKLYEGLLDSGVHLGSMADFYRFAGEMIRRATIDLARSIRGPHGIATNTDSHVGLLEASGVSSGEADRFLAQLDADLEQWAAFHEAVGDLPEQQAAVFRLHFYSGLSFAQIAEMFALEPDSVGRTYRRACEKLTALLADSDHFSGESSETG